MLWPSNLRVFVHQAPMDMRCGFLRLSAMAYQVVDINPLDGHLFVFCNKKSNRVKILYWDGDGWALWYKCLEKGTFALSNSDEITTAQLQLLLSGIDLKNTIQRKRYQRSSAAN